MNGLFQIFTRTPAILQTVIARLVGCFWNLEGGPFFGDTKLCKQA